MSVASYSDLRAYDGGITLELPDNLRRATSGDDSQVRFAYRRRLRERNVEGLLPQSLGRFCGRFEHGPHTALQSSGSSGSGLPTAILGTITSIAGRPKPAAHRLSSDVKNG